MGPAKQNKNSENKCGKGQKHILVLQKIVPSLWGAIKRRETSRSRICSKLDEIKFLYWGKNNVDPQNYTRISWFLWKQ